MENTTKFVHGDQAEKFPEKIDFASNINPFPPRDLQEFISGMLWKVKYYPESSYADLVEVISDTFDWKRDEIVFGNGSIELIRAFFMLQKGKVAIPYPTFTEYERFARGFGLTVVKCRIEDLIETVKAEKPDAAVVCNPNNPTGEFFDWVEDLDRLAGKMGFKLLVDEAFIDFTRKKLSLENAFVVRSLTKILGIPGLRFGYGRFSEKYAKKFHSIRDPWNVNILAKEVAKKYIPRLNSISRRVSGKIKRERTFLEKRLKKLGFSCKGDVNFLLVRGKYDGKAVRSFLFERGILVRTCEDFEGLNEKYFRIAVKDRKSNRVLLKNLEVFVEENP